MIDSPSLDVGEKYAAQGATHPRITLDYMKSEIAHTSFSPANANMLAKDKREYPSVGNVTICTLVLKSGFVVIGKSASMSPGNYDYEKGQTFAYEDAIRHLWPLFAFHQLQAKYEQAQRDD